MDLVNWVRFSDKHVPLPVQMFLAVLEAKGRTGKGQEDMLRWGVRVPVADPRDREPPS